MLQTSHDVATRLLHWIAIITQSSRGSGTVSTLRQFWTSLLSPANHNPKCKVRDVPKKADKRDWQISHVCWTGLTGCRVCPCWNNERAIFTSKQKFQNRLYKFDIYTQIHNLYNLRRGLGIVTGLPIMCRVIFLLYSSILQNNVDLRRTVGWPGT